MDALYIVVPDNPSFPGKRRRLPTATKGERITTKRGKRGEDVIVIIKI